MKYRYRKVRSNHFLTLISIANIQDLNILKKTMTGCQFDWFVFVPLLCFECILPLSLGLYYNGMN